MVLKDNKKVVSNPENKLVIVNKTRKLPPDFVPSNLIIPDISFSFEGDLPKKYLKQEAAKALEKLYCEAKENNIVLAGVSGYRPYKRQREIFISQVKEKGLKKANKISAPPGCSEHQTGLAVDISSPKVDYKLVKEFGDTEEGKWLAANAYQFGFILRYPEGKTQITGYQYEPWHLRYVGEKHAEIIYRERLTLEEYLKQYIH